MAWTVETIDLGLERLLIAEADSEQEQAELIDRSVKKGWTFVAKGRVPNSSKYGAWFKKPGQTQGVVQMGGQQQANRNGTGGA